MVFRLPHGFGRFTRWSFSLPPIQSASCPGQPGRPSSAGVCWAPRPVPRGPRGPLLLVGQRQWARVHARAGTQQHSAASGLPEPGGSPIAQQERSTEKKKRKTRVRKKQNKTSKINSPKPLYMFSISANRSLPN